MITDFIDEGLDSPGSIISHLNPFEELEVDRLTNGDERVVISIRQDNSIHLLGKPDYFSLFLELRFATVNNIEQPGCLSAGHADQHQGCHGGINRQKPFRSRWNLNQIIQEQSESDRRGG